MTKMPTIQVRIDAKTKHEAGKILGDLGLDFSKAVRIYLRKVIDERGIPFPVILRKQRK